VFYVGVAKIEMLHMLQWLYMYVSSICFDCFIYFRRMLQVFHLDVVKVDLVLHMLYGTHLPSCMRVRSGGVGSGGGWRQGHGLSPLLRVEPDNF
jgi:hypothetical protein